MKAEAVRTEQASVAEDGRNAADAAPRAEVDMATRRRTKAEVATTGLMEAVVERGNLWLAYQRVVENKGAAGVDQLTVPALKDHLKQHWPTIRTRLLVGQYQPQPVRRVDIPKPQGGVRTLGIPTVVDRLIQQALHQVLQPMRQAQQYVAQGKRWVVDIDLRSSLIGSTTIYC